MGSFCFGRTVAYQKSIAGDWQYITMLLKEVGDLLGIDDVIDLSHATQT